VLTVLSAAVQQVCSSNTFPKHFPRKLAGRLTRQLFSQMKDFEMNNSLARDMIEATRLTQAGRLSEATALLQKLLRGERFSSTKPHGRDTTRATIALPAPIIDLVAEIEDIADVEAFSAKEPPSGTDGVQRDAGLHLAGPLRGVFDRFNLRGSAQALRGLRKRSPPLPSDIVPAGGQFVAKSFSNEAGSRAYKLYIPSRYHGEPRPLIVMLHGCIQSPDDFAAGTRMNFGAEEHACLVVYPEQAVAANSSKCWNWFKSRDQKRGQGEPSLIAGITRQVMTDYKIDPRRIYIAGLSAGGAAAAVVGEAYPDLYAAVGVHSGLACGVARDLPSAFAAMRGEHSLREPKSSGQPGEYRLNLPTIVFHGDRDATVHPRNGAEVVARAMGSGGLRTSVEHGSVAAGHTYTRSIQRDASGQRVLEQWVIHGAGHAWSGGSPAGSFTDPKGPDATKEMLRFFLEQVRPEC
jgi:poly(hydroxyalkanoate) depolymerase family esterase